MYNFIVNPIAGGGKAKKVIKTISKILDERKIQYRVFFSSYKGHMAEIAKTLEKSGDDNIIVLGGDGSFHEVVNGIKNLNKITLGLIPSGTGNDFARTLNLSTNPQKAIESILKNKVGNVDFFEVAGTRAINSVSIGIDVDVIRRYNNAKSRSKGTYYASLLASLFNFKFKQMQFDVDKQEENEDEYFVAAACNGKFFGGGMEISPNSNCQDGKIHFVAIRKVKTLQIVTALIGFLKGKHLNKPYTSEYVCEQIVSNTLTEGNTQTINCDGELIDNAVFDVRVVKGGMKMFLAN